MQRRSGWIGNLREAFAAAHEDPAFFRNLLVSATILLLTAGTIFVFSASFYQAGGIDGNPFYFFRKHLLWMPIAVLTCLVTYQFDYRLLARHGNWALLMAFTMVLLALVLVPAIGLKVNFSRRWLPLGSLQFQPSELAKLVGIIFVAGYFSQNPARLRRFLAGFVPLVLVLLGLIVLVLAEPDFGTAIFLLSVTGSVLLIAGVRKRYLIASGVVFGPILATGVLARWDLVQTRLLGFLDPEKVYQVRHSLYALGNGGLFGVGVGAATQKLRFLPEPHTDFIFAIVGEELGYLGTVGLLLLFAILVVGCAGIAWRARDYFGFLLASGVTISLGLQALTNIAVVTGSAPTKGIPLPFLTSGGSGLCMTMAQIGVLLSVDRIRRLEGPLPAATSAASAVADERTAAPAGGLVPRDPHPAGTYE